MLAQVPGVRRVQVNPWTGSVLVHFDPRRLTETDLVAALVRPAARPPVAHEVAAALEPAGTGVAAAAPAAGGLSEDQVRRRRLRYGLNRLPTPPTVPFWRRFLQEFTDLTSVILLTGTGLAVLAGRVTEALAVGAAAGLSALIGAWRAGELDRAVAALSALAPPHATVVRGGTATVIPATDLVPGDLVLLRAGDRVPADVAVVACADLEVDDRHLLAADAAGPQAVTGAGSPLAAGSAVRHGWARAVVVATGPRTEIGRIAQTLGRVNRLPSPAERRLARLTRDLLKVALLALGAVTAAGLLRGLAPLEILTGGVSLAAAALPRALPVYLTLALAAGARRLARRRAYVRDLSAAEGVGAVDVICTDKTATLTRGEMTVRTVYTGGTWWTVTGTGFDPTGQFLRAGVPTAPLNDPDLRALAELAARCNDAVLAEGPEGNLEVTGSQTEGALLVLALKAGLPPEIGREPRLHEEAFDPDRRQMTITLGLDDARLTCSKGAPETILPRCTHMLAGGQTLPLDHAGRAAIAQAVQVMTASAYRVLSLAYARDDRSVDQFVFVGLVGITDPPRTEIRPVIRRLAGAGVRTVMLTGDHPDTAAAVARSLGLLPSQRALLTGARLSQLTDPQLLGLVDQVTVFARVTPEQKARVIRALQRRGHTVAFLGDGMDDAPAMRAADIGVAPQPRAVDATREAAAIILDDDRFEALATVLEQGRATARNVDEIVRYSLAASTAEILVLVAAAVCGMPLALLPLQLLWLNLIADAPAALALGERHATVAADLPVRSGRRVQTLEREILYHSLEMGAAAFGLYAGALAGGSGLPAARTMALTALGAGQILYLFRCRTALGTPCGLQLPAEPVVGMAAGVSALLLATTVYLPPLAAALGAAPLSVGQWLGVLGAALAGNLSTVAGFSLQPRPEAAPALG